MVGTILATMYGRSSRAPRAVLFASTRAMATDGARAGRVPVPWALGALAPSRTAASATTSGAQPD